MRHLSRYRHASRNVTLVTLEDIAEALADYCASDTRGAHFGRSAGMQVAR